MGHTCRVHLEIDGGDPPHIEASEALTGTVYVEVDEEVRCNGLRVFPQWEAHGKGDVDLGSGDETVLFEGTWQPGEVYEYAFEIEAPSGPYTYDGHHFDVEWSLVARPDIPWTIDPSAEATFLLEPGGREAYEPGGESAADVLADPPDEPRVHKWFNFLFGLAAGGFGLLFTFIGVTDLYWGTAPVGPSIFFALLGLPFMAIGWGIAYLMAPNYLPALVLEEVDIEAEPAELGPGDEVTCRVGVRPRTGIRLQRVFVQLLGAEKAVRGGRGNRKTFGESLHETEVVPEASRDVRLPSGERTEYRATVAIPESAPPTILADHNEVSWLLVVRVELDWWPDWAWQRRLLVRPEPD